MTNLEAMRVLASDMFNAKLFGATENEAIQKAYSALMEQANKENFGENEDAYAGAMTCNEYQRLAARTISRTLRDEEKEYHALHGMAGEIGELHSIYQKIYQGHSWDSEHAKKEVGDLIWFVAEYCTAQGWTLEEVMTLNIEKLKTRYPDGFEAEKSLHRADGDI